MAVEIQAEQNEPNLLECRTFPGTLKTRIDAAGTVVTAVQAPPADNDLSIGECAWWYDIANDMVKFKARKDGSTVLTGEVELT